MGYGERVAWLRRSEYAARSAWELARKKDIPERMFETIQERYNEISRTLQEAEQENDNVYFQAVPDPRVLALPDGHALQTLSVDRRLLESSSPFLASLLLPWMRAAEESFKSRLNVTVQTYATKVSSAVREIREQLTDAGLPASVAEVNSLPRSTVPDVLWNRIVNEVHAQGGVLHLTADAQENSKLNDALAQKVKDLQSALYLERDADENFRVQFGPRYILAPSRDLNALMIEDIVLYRSLLVQAKQKDEQVTRMLADNAGYLDLLTRTREQLSQFIPGLSQTEDLKTETIRQELNAAYQDLEAKLLDCETTQAAFAAATAQATIIPDLERITRDATLASDCVTAGLDKFTKDTMSALDAKLGSLRAKYSNVLERNHAYGAMRKQNEVSHRREKALMSLNQALSRYAEIASVIHEGNGFYVDLKTQLAQLERGISDFCFIRNGKRDDGSALAISESLSTDDTSSRKTPVPTARKSVPPPPPALRSVPPPPIHTSSGMMRQPWKI